jgi:hypothetical protein
MNVAALVFAFIFALVKAAKADREIGDQFAGSRHQLQIQLICDGTDPKQATRSVTEATNCACRFANAPPQANPNEQRTICHLQQMRLYGNPKLDLERSSRTE